MGRVRRTPSRPTSTPSAPVGTAASARARKSTGRPASARRATTASPAGSSRPKEPSAKSSFPADFRQAPIINGAGATTYPIASYTYLLAYLDQKDAEKGKTFVAFAYWALTDGQAD